MKKTGSRARQTEWGRQLIITGLPVFSKLLFYLTLPVTEKRRHGGKREERERRTEAQALVHSHPHHTNVKKKKKSP